MADVSVDLVLNQMRVRAGSLVVDSAVLAAQVDQLAVENARLQAENGQLRELLLEATNQEPSPVAHPSNGNVSHPVQM